MRCAILLTIAGLIASATSVYAQEHSLQALETADDIRGWEAVGRLDFGHRSFCTGTLIAPDLVLTAAHCIYDKETGEKVDVGDIEYRAGWRNGRAEAYRGARGAQAHPDYVPEPTAKTLGMAPSVAYDIALIRLDRPIRNTRIQPFETAPSPRTGDPVSVVSYAQDRAEKASYESDCKVLQRRFGVLVLTCSVDFGSSGSPVFIVGENGPQIGSVVSAKATFEGQPVALSARLDDTLATLRKAIENAEDLPKQGAGVRFLGAGRREIGARFVKP